MKAADWRPDEEDEAFLRVYGDWQPWGIEQAAAEMAGFPAPWWVVGGHAIEAFTGVHRMHEDIDIVIFDHDVPHLRAQLGARYHLWSNYGGTFRIIDDDHPEPLDPLSQIWVREHAGAPWVADCILNPSVDGRWRSKRDEAHVADLEDVTWVADDGVRYLNPEIALLFKGAQQRVKDDIDLASAWPLLDDDRRAWLRAAVRRTYGDEHPWLRGTLEQ